MSTSPSNEALLSKPGESLLADLKMPGIPRLNICLVQRVEPYALSMLVAGKGIGEMSVLFLGELAPCGSLAFITLAHSGGYRVCRFFATICSNS
ncbi:hypothetical protein HJB89_05775 [Rhizobium sp. NZLR8]|nr:hypothetical protein [Rhizobium sp. NZLR8]